MKLYFCLIFSLIDFLGFSQGIKDIDLIYQKILDDENFINKIQKDSTFHCDTDFVYIPADNDSLLILDFQGKLIRKYEIGEKIISPIFKFKYKKQSENSFCVKVSIEKSCWQSERGFLAKTITYTCILKRKNDSYKLKNIKIYNGIRSTDFR
jgi:hypothetical protein